MSGLRDVLSVGIGVVMGTVMMTGREIGRRGRVLRYGENGRGEMRGSTGQGDPGVGRGLHLEEEIMGRGTVGGGMRARGDDKLLAPEIIAFTTCTNKTRIDTTMIYPIPKSHDSQPLRLSTTTTMSGYNVLFVLVIVAALMVTSWVFTPKGPNQT